MTNTTAKAPLSVEGKSTVTIDPGANVQMPINVNGGTLKIGEGVGTPTVSDVTVKGGTVEAGSNGINAKNLTVQDGTLTGTVTVQESVQISGGNIGNVSGQSVSVSGTAKVSSVAAPEVSISGGTVGTASGNSLTINGGTVTKTEGKELIVSGDAKITEAVSDKVTIAGGSIGTATTNKVVVKDSNAVKDMKIQADAGKTLSIDGLSQEQAKDMLKNVTTASGSSDVKVNIFDNQGGSYIADVKVEGGKTEVGEVTEDKSTKAQLRKALYKAQGDVALELKTKDGKQQILISQNGQPQVEIGTVDDKDQAIDLADMKIGPNVKNLAVNLGEYDKEVMVGGDMTVPLTVEGGKNAKLSIGDKVSTKNVTVKSNLTVTVGDGVVMDSLTVAEGATLKATPKAVNPNTTVKVGTLEVNGTVAGTVNSNHIVLGAKAGTDALQVGVLGGSDGAKVIVEAKDRATAEAFLDKNVTVIDAKLGEETTVIGQIKVPGGYYETTIKVDKDGNKKIEVDPVIKRYDAKTTIETYLSENKLADVMNGVVDPFDTNNRLPSQTDLNTIWAEINKAETVISKDAQGKETVLTADEAYKQLMNNLVASGRQATDPVGASRHGQYVLTDAALSGVADRLYERRSEQEGYVVDSGAKVPANMQAEPNNMWASIKHGQTDIGKDIESTTKYNYYQIGYDHQVSDTAFAGLYLGVATGDMTVNSATADIDKAYDIGIYTTKLLDQGQYYNIIGRYSKMSNTYKSMKWDDNGFGLGFEYGQKLVQPGGFTMTPYVRVDYGHTGSSSTMAGVNSVDIDGLNSFGLKLGAKFEDKDAAGNSVYGGVAYSHGMSGVSKTLINSVRMPDVSNKLQIFTMNIGVKRHVGENSYIDLNVEKAVLDSDGWNVQGAVQFYF